MAGIFAIVGPSVWALRAEPILLSLIVVWLTWKLASALADTARLPLHAKQWFMTIAAFLAAIPPLYDTVLELRTLGGYVEIFIFMLLLMLFALELTNRRAAGASRRELAWRWACIGFIIGLGLWVNPLICYAILAAAIWIAWDWVKALREARKSKIIHDNQYVIIPRPAYPPRYYPRSPNLFENPAPSSASQHTSMHSRANAGDLLGSIKSMAEYHLYTAIKRKPSTSSHCTSTISYTIGHIFRVSAFIYHLRRTKDPQWRAAWRKCCTRFFTYTHFHYVVDYASWPL